MKPSRQTVVLTLKVLGILCIGTAILLVFLANTGILPDNHIASTKESSSDVVTIKLSGSTTIALLLSLNIATALSLGYLVKKRLKHGHKEMGA